MSPLSNRQQAKANRRHDRRVRSQRRRNSENGFVSACILAVTLGGAGAVWAVNEGLHAAGNAIHEAAGPREKNIQGAFDDGTVVKEGPNKPRLLHNGAFLLHLHESDTATSNSVIQVSCDGTNVHVADVTTPGRSDRPDSWWDGADPACATGTISSIGSIAGSTTILLPLSVTN